MAIQRIPGNMLEQNLERDGVDLAFQTDLLYLDVTNERIGVRTDAPGAYALDVNGSARFVDDVTIQGDLIVDGVTTSLDTQTLTIEDPILELAKNNSGGSPNGVDQGILFNRGSLDNTAFFWDESTQTFAFAVAPSEDGSTYGDITISSYADIRLANAQVESITLDGLDLNDNSIVGTRSDEDINITPSGSGAVVMPTASVDDLTVNTDAVILGNLTVSGTTTTVDTQNLIVEDNLLVINSNNSAATDAGIMINRGDAQNPAVIYWDENTNLFRAGTTTSDGSTRDDLTNVTLVNIQAADPLADDDLVTKRYFEENASGSGAQLALGSPDGFTDSQTESVATSFTDGAYPEIGSADSITDAIAALNETMENIREATYVQSVDFTADVVTMSAGETVTLTITHVGGGADRYAINWGDGSPVETVTTATPSHTYNTSVGSPFDVRVKAFANDAVTDSAGSFAVKTREDYILVYTATPVAGFEIYDSATAGNVVTTSDDGNTVYLENTTTNTSGATVSYTVDWGDGTVDTISADADAGGAAGSRLAHTYNNASGDTRYVITFTLASHSTANPVTVPQTETLTFDVYSLQTPAITADSGLLRGVNEEGTNGFSATFTNSTTGNPGSRATFSNNIYNWDFDNGLSPTAVSVGSNADGDTGEDITNVFRLTSAEQAAGTTRTFDVELSLTTGHSGSPFTSSTVQVTVEPDVRANLAGTASTASTGSNDNQYTLYDHTDLNGNNRALVDVTNSSQNADSYVYSWDDGSADDNVTEDGTSAGSVGVVLTHDYAGNSVGSYDVTLTASGTPDTIAQTDSETIQYTIKAVPSAPADLSTKTLLLDTAYQGNSPALTAGATDNTGAFDSLSAGDSLASSTARRYTTGTVNTAVVSNAYNGASGTLSASINGVDSGSIEFDTSDNSGTSSSLNVTSNVDYQDVDSTYPQDFYQVFSARISDSIGSYSVGVNAQRLEHSSAGDTDIVHIVNDDVTAVPTVSIGSLSQNTAGTLTYISGVPYYGSSSSRVDVVGTTVEDFTGVAYADVNDPVEITAGTVQEGSGSIISSTDFTYSQVDGSTTMLTGGIPNTNTGVGTPYTLGTTTVSIAGASKFSVGTLKVRAKNCNGTSSYSESSTAVQVFTATPSGINNETAIPVSNSLGAGYTDNGKRVTGFSSSDDTPSYTAADFYTDNEWSGAVTVAGTSEAIVRPSTTSTGTLQHYTSDLSTGYLPVGPDLATGRSGAQYFTFAFRRTIMANFVLRLTGTVSAVYIASPGTAIDSASTLNGWLDASLTYAGAGVPGANTANGGNGSNGCAFTSGDRIQSGTAYSNQGFTLTLGSENATNATGNNVLVRIKLEDGDSLTAISVE